MKFVAQKDFQRSVYWTRLSGVNTRYTVYESDKNQSVSKLMIIVIPGNPGNDRYYEKFCGTLMQSILVADRNLRIVSVSHANHVLIDKNDANNFSISEDFASFTKNNTIRYNLDHQVQHKIDFCNTIIFPMLTEDEEIHLVGHSIGALICLRIIPKITLENITNCFALFPAVERMAQTPQGCQLRNVLRFFDSCDIVTSFITFFLEIVPNSIKRKMCAFVLGNSLAKNTTERNCVESMPECIINATLEIIKTNVLRNIVHMSNHELLTVNDFDDSLLSKAKQKNISITFFYGTKDKWSPLVFAEDMRKKIAKTTFSINENLAFHEVLVDEEGRLEHAFVVHSSVEMAEKLCSIIMKTQKKTGENTKKK